jgi:hypothetical protein
MLMQATTLLPTLSNMFAINDDELSDERNAAYKPAMQSLTGMRYKDIRTRFKGTTLGTPH